jgi:hypothetical protein
MGFWGHEIPNLSHTGLEAAQVTSEKRCSKSLTNAFLDDNSGPFLRMTLVDAFCPRKLVTKGEFAFKPNPPAISGGSRPGLDTKSFAWKSIVIARSGAVNPPEDA